jgi:hypothetical protein
MLNLTEALHEWEEVLAYYAKIYIQKKNGDGGILVLVVGRSVSFPLRATVP